MKPKLSRFMLLIPTLFLCASMLASCEQYFSEDSSSNSLSSFIISEHNFYENPTYPRVNGVETPTYIADPFIVRDGDLFYLYCTQTNVYAPTLAFKRGPVFSSSNMVDWTYVADVFENYLPTWGTQGAGVWAPTVIKVGDVWNFYYSFSTGGDSNPGIGVATAPTPCGPWTHYGKLFTSLEIGVTNSIDPFVFADEGHLYMAFGSYGGLITIIELTSDGLGLFNGLSFQYEHKVAIAGYEINELNNYEATFILKRDGFYYLFLSTGSCCSGAKSTYKVVVARSPNLFGPYTDSSGKNMFGPNRGDPVVVPSMSGAMGTGHCAVMSDDAGQFWMVYHGYDTTGPQPDYRVLYLDRLIFDETTGMPSVENKKASNGITKAGPYLTAWENSYA